MLQAINTTIDTIQGAKSTFVKTFVKDESIAKSLQAFVDSQTAFTKQVAKTTFDVSTKVAEEALVKATSFFDKPVGKFFGIENDPVYNAEAARRIMDYAAQNVDKGADYIAKNTGMSKSDAQWFINAALLKAAPTAGKIAKKTGKKYWLSDTVGEDFNDYHIRVGLFKASQSLKPYCLK